MKRTLFLIILILILSTGTALAKVVSQPLSYMHDGATLEGYLAYGGADLKGVVSFHGSLIPPSAEQAGRARAKILIATVPKIP